MKHPRRNSENNPPRGSHEKKKFRNDLMKQDLKEDI
jgi:hypothetical protein